MDWLSRHGAKIDSQKQRVSLKQKEGRKLYLWGDNSSIECPVISLMVARKLVRYGCVGYLCCVMKDRKKAAIKLEDIPMVKEFSDLFLEEILGLPPRGRLTLK